MLIRYVTWNLDGTTTTIEELFEVEATAEGVFADAALARRGLAFE